MTDISAAFLLKPDISNIEYVPKLISSSSLYNLLQRKDNPILLIDARSPSEIGIGSIMRSISILPVQGEVTSKTISQSISIEEHLTLFKKCQGKDVIIFDAYDMNKQKIKDRWALRLANFFKRENQAHSIKLLADNFSSFQRKYPFMISKEYFFSSDNAAIIKGTDFNKKIEPFPTVIEEGFLYVGKTCDATNERILRTLKITHILNCSSSPHNQILEDLDIKHFHMRIENNEDVITGASIAFDKAYDFLISAKECERPRVLIHSANGRSRCCMVAVYYLMRSREMTLASAYQYVLKHRTEMYPKEAIVVLLMRKEMELRRKCSLSKYEVRDLIAGRLNQNTIERPSMFYFRLSKGCSPSVTVNATEQLDLIEEEVDKSNEVIRGSSASLPEAHKVESSGVSSKEGFKTSKPSSFDDNLVKAPKRHIVIQMVNCSWLYNRLQTDSGLLLLDARSREEFEVDTIRSAISVPPVPNCKRISDLDEHILPEQKYYFSRRRLVEIIIFGDVIHGKVEDSWGWRLAKLVVEEGQATSVRFIDNSFTAFRFRYPFLSTDFDCVSPGGLMRTSSGMHSVSYPNEIIPGFLYLGNMWQASQEQVFNNLNITHVVNASLDCGNVFADKDVKYCNVLVKDKEYSNISQYFHRTYDFIESAGSTSGCRVLVHCTQGVSRSSTIVIYYMMRYFNWSLVSAVNHTMSCRGVIYPNTGFLHQLFVAERKLYRGNSLTEEEFDLLLQGGIQDRPVPISKSRNASKEKEKCAVCENFSFSIFHWRYSCRYCKESVCGKCSSSRLLHDKDEISKGQRVCDHCVRLMSEIHLPLLHKPQSNRRRLIRRYLNLKSANHSEKPIQISYYEGTEPHHILDLIRIRFDVTSDGVLELLLKSGESWNVEQKLPDNAVLFVSVGAHGRHDT